MARPLNARAFLGAAGEALSIGLEALSRYKLRTALSVLGVVLGVTAVIAMMSVSEGARREALEQIELLGLGNVVVRSRPLPAGADGGPSAGLRAGEARALQALVPLVTTAVPLVERPLDVSAGGAHRVSRVVGVTEEYADLLQLRVRRGRFLAALDLRGPTRVCVLGGVLARQLFGPRDPVGAEVKVGGEWYHVVGILADRATQARGLGALAGRDMNLAAIVPVSALLGAPLAADPGRPIDELWLHVGDAGRVLEAGRAVEHALQRLHRGARDVEVVVPRELLDQRLRTQRTFGIVVGSVAALSLLVGGIGIMNIMLASVLERTHEIGIRRTVGARRRDVTVQFLAEAVLMTLTGGGVGLAAGVAVSWAITAYAGWVTHVSLAAVLLALSVSAAVGLGFGIYPATKAARLNPIDALRYE